MRELALTDWCEDEIEPVGVDDRSMTEMAEYVLDRFLVSIEFGEIDLLGVDTSTIDGFPENTTDTALAVTS